MNTCSTDSRLNLIRCIVRRYLTETHRRSTSYDIDDLISHLYVCIDDKIKRQPLVDRSELITYGVSRCHKWIKELAYSKTRQTVREATREESIDRKDRTYVDCSDGRDTAKLLSIWCKTREERIGVTAITRVMRYLHFVEGMPIEEIAEIFNKSLKATHSHIMYKKQTPMLLKKNDIVTLVMDNPFFHGMLAWVKEPTEFGAIVEVESHTYPNRTKWELRCVHSEMVYIGTLSNRPSAPPKPEGADGSKKVVSNAHATHKGVTVYVEPVPLATPRFDPQFTGDECMACGKMMMVRAGTCLTCTNCGTTSGCS